MSHTSGGDRQLTEELREHLLAKGADLVGFGLVKLMEGAPDIQRPERYLPDARSMIAIGLAINGASCDLIARSVRERSVPASYHSYQFLIKPVCRVSSVRRGPLSRGAGIVHVVRGS
jgi:hypothetical protein